MNNISVMVQMEAKDILELFVCNLMNITELRVKLPQEKNTEKDTKAPIVSHNVLLFNRYQWI